MLNHKSRCWFVRRGSHLSVHRRFSISLFVLLRLRLPTRIRFYTNTRNIYFFSFSRDPASNRRHRRVTSIRPLPPSARSRHVPLAFPRLPLSTFPFRPHNSIANRSDFPRHDAARTAKYSLERAAGCARYNAQRPPIEYRLESFTTHKHLVLHARNCLAESEATRTAREAKRRASGRANSGVMVARQRIAI